MKKTYYCPPTNRREAIRNIVLSQRKATAAFLEGRPVDFSLETSNGFGIDAYSSQFMDFGESAKIRHRVMYKLFMKDSEKRGEFPREIYLKMTRNYREMFLVSLQQDTSAREAA